MAIDTNGNGEIEVSEAVLIRSLNIILASGGVADLAGLAQFTQLASLNFRGFIGPTFNLNPMPELNVLRVSNCLFTAIDLSSVNNLQIVDLSDNQLESLDVSMLPCFEN